IILLNYLAHALRWRVILFPLKRIKISGLFSPIFVGNLGNLFPVRAGPVIRAYLLGKKYAIPFSSSLATVVVLRLFDVFFHLGLFAWVFIFHAHVFSSEMVFFEESFRSLAVKFGQFSAVAVAIAVVLTYLLAFHEEKFLVLVRWVTQYLPQKWQEKIIFRIDQFNRGLIVLKNVRSLVKITFYSALEWAANVLSYYPLYWAYGLEDKSIASLLVLTVMVSIVVNALPTPAFFGSFNLAVLIALHGIMGEAEVVAVSFGMVAWAIKFVVPFILAVYFILHDYLSVSKLMQVIGEGRPVPEK
ncbi:MAG: YbhN family protein, partial [Nitrospinales bacterium]